MLWSSLFLALPLLANGMFDSNSLAEDGPYWVGDGYNLTWTPTVLDSEYVDIVLFYGDDLQSSWTIMTNFSNKGTEISLTIGEDLSNSVGQLLIANGTMGQFRLEIPSNDMNPNITVRSYNVTTLISIYQTVIFSTGGRLFRAGERTIIDDLTVYVRKETYLNKIGSDSARWMAQFVTVNEDDMTWTTRDSLGLASGPTAAPTQAPTPMPTIANNTNSSDSDSDPIVIGSLINKNENKATTPSPTTVYTTGSAKRRLLQQLSLKDVTLGVSGNDEIEYNQDNSMSLGICGPTTTDTWCEFDLTLTVPETAKSGGPFYLAVGVMNHSDSKLQYYAINNNTNAMNQMSQFVVYNSSDLMFDLSYSMSNRSLFWKYEDVGMSVSLGDNMTEVEVYVALWNPAKDSYHYLECGSHTTDYYTSFGWKTTPEFGMNTSLPQAAYQFELYWGAVDFTTALSDSDLYRFEGGSMPFVSILDEFNGTSTAAVNIKDDKKKFSKGRNKIEFETAFNEGTMLTGYIEQCDYVSNYTMNDTTPCHYYTQSVFNFTYKKGDKVEINFPDSLYKTKLSNMNDSVTYLYVSALLCDGETELTTQIPIEIVKKSSGSSGLSAGAIVGIVCAGVLVLGLAAWWLCMKKGGGDQYRELDG